MGDMIVARHLDTTHTADSGASATFDGIVYANANAIGRADVWAGNPDTDKHWNKGE